MSERPRILIARKVFSDVVDRLREHFDVQTNDSDTVYSADELRAHMADKDGVFITASEKIDAGLIAACPRLKAICLMAVGYNAVDVAACAARGISVTNTPDVLTETTADFGMALLLATARRVTESEHYLRAGKWTKWSYDMFAGAEVHGSTLGIIGMGRIGQGIARRAHHGFGMKVVYHNRTRLDKAEEALYSAQYMSKDELLQTADHVMLVLPYSAQSHHTIAARELAMMKPTATLINIARGGIVDDAELAEALKVGRIAAAGLDVFEGEPKLHPGLLDVPNVVLTPHIASASVPTRRAMANLAADNLIAVLNGRPALTPVRPQH
jgi:gluconate 2-dehydrogenase